MTHEPPEVTQARDRVEAEVGQVWRLTVDLLTQCGELPLSDVLRYLEDNVRSDDVVSEALMRLLASNAVTLDERRWLSL